MTEKHMRATYRLAFGKEYDDPNRRLWPLPLKIAYDVALLKIKQRIEEIRHEIEGKNVSYGELFELQGFKKYIDKSDNLLLEWAGVPEK